MPLPVVSEWGNQEVMLTGHQFDPGTDLERHGVRGVPEVAGLADQNVVSLRSLLFKNGNNPPELIASKVRKR